MKRSCESDWLRRNGSGRRARFGCSQESGFGVYNKPALELSKRPAL